MAQLNAVNIKAHVLDSLGISNLPEETQDEIISIATGSILQSVHNAVLSRMPESAQKEFVDAFTGGNGEKAQQLLTTHIPDSDAFVAQEIQKATEEFRKLYAGA